MSTRAQQAQQLAEALLEQEYSLGNTSLKVPVPLNDFVIKWGRMNIPDDAVYWDEDGGCGRETDPHITVLYGLTENAPSVELLDIVRKTKPFTVRLGPISIFENDAYDVVKFEVISDALVDLSNAIRMACPNENKYPKYVPHCTVAYCKKGVAAKLSGVYPFETDPPIPNEFEASELVFSAAGDDTDPSRLVQVLPFNRYRKESAKETLSSFVQQGQRQSQCQQRCSICGVAYCTLIHREDRAKLGLVPHLCAACDQKQFAKLLGEGSAKQQLKRFKRMTANDARVRAEVARADAEAQQVQAELEQEVEGAPLLPVGESVEKEAAKAEPEPTDAQKEAGNYAKGHARLHGFDIAIENAKGSIRSGECNGKKWSVKMPSAYGYIKGTKGKDKDHIDAFIGPDEESETAYVIDQQKREGGFDEHKVMLGFKDRESAVETYDKAFTGDLGPKLRGAVTGASIADLKQWLKDGDTTKPYASVLKEGSAKDFVKKTGRHLIWEWFPDGYFGFTSETKRTEATGFVAWVIPKAHRYKVQWVTGAQVSPVLYATREDAQAAAEAALPPAVWIKEGAKQVLRQLLAQPWSYEVEDDPEFPGNYTATFYYRGERKGTLPRDSLELLELQAEGLAKRLNALEQRMPFDSRDFGTCWNWLDWGDAHPNVQWDAREWSRADDQRAAQEGWLLTTRDDGHRSIERYDAFPMFDNDAAAWSYVKVHAAAGSALHQKAVNLVDDPVLLRLESAKGRRSSVGKV